MHIAVSADNKNGIDSVISPHFGRCPCFVLVDLEDHDVQDVREVDNPYYGAHQPGQVPAFIHSLDADVMLTGGMGGRAIAFFQQFGIEGVTGAYGTVRQSVERYLGGELRGAAPCSESQEHGHGDVAAEIEGGEYEKDELGRLKEEAEMLRRQLEEVTARLGNLEIGIVPPIYQSANLPTYWKEEEIMGRGQGQGRGGGSGRGGGRGPGRMGGTKAAGPSGSCVCPSCGHKVKHQVGTPCYDIKCPKCGAAMTRE